jgi:selenium metabolism protein YedF
MKQINTCGKLCPAPLILTKKGILDANAGEEIEIIVDNETAFTNLLSYLEELNITPTHTQQGGIFTIKITKPTEIDETVDEVAYCSTNQTTDYVVVIKSDKMGSGDDTLGSILLRAFINSLQEVESLPTTIILYNSGVNVALKGCDTAESLKVLEDRGVTIISCGACLDFYDVKEQLAVGVISNMFKITSVLSKAGHVVYP